MDLVPRNSPNAVCGTVNCFTLKKLREISSVTAALSSPMGVNRLGLICLDLRGPLTLIQAKGGFTVLGKCDLGALNLASKLSWKSSCFHSWF